MGTSYLIRWDLIMTGLLIKPLLTRSTRSLAAGARRTSCRRCRNYPVAETSERGAPSKLPESTETTGATDQPV